MCGVVEGKKKSLSAVPRSRIDLESQYGTIPLIDVEPLSQGTTLQVGTHRRLLPVDGSHAEKVSSSNVCPPGLPLHDVKVLFETFSVNECFCFHFTTITAVFLVMTFFTSCPLSDKEAHKFEENDCMVRNVALVVSQQEKRLQLETFTLSKPYLPGKM